MSLAFAQLSAHIVEKLTETLQARLSGRDEALPDPVSLTLRRHKGPLFFCLRNQGERVAEGWFEAENWLEATKLALQEFSLIPEEARGIVTTVDFVAAGAERRPFDRSRFREDGLRGLACSYQGEESLFSPTSLAADNWTMSSQIDEFLESEAPGDPTARDKLKLHEFDCDCWLLNLKSGSAKRLRGGLSVVEPSSVNAALCDQLAELWGGYLIQSVQNDGRMRYLYSPSYEDEASKSNNMIRQWMATLALCKFGQSDISPNLDELISKNISYNLEHFYRQKGALGEIEWGGKVKLGAIALAVLAIASHREGRDFSKAKRGLSSTLDHLWQDTGEFRTFLRPADRNDMQNFYSGEALLCWAHRYLESKDERLLKKLQNSFRFYRAHHLHPQRRSPAFVPWHTQAYYLLYGETQDPELRDFIFDMNDWLLRFQIWPSLEAPEYAGRFHDREGRHGPPHASSTGVFLEGLVDAFSLAREVGDAERAENYRLAICRGLRSLAQLTFKDDVDLYYVRHREKLRGGVRTTCRNNQVRVDNVQHGLLALLKIRATFEPEDYLCESQDFPPLSSLNKVGSFAWQSHSLLQGLNPWTKTASVNVLLPFSESDLSEEFEARVESFLDIGTPPGSKLESLKTDSNALRRLVELALKLQKRVDCLIGEVVIDEATSNDGRKCHRVIFESEYPEIGIRAFALACHWAEAFKKGSLPRSSLRRLHESFRRFAQNHLPPPMRREIARAAQRRGLYWQIIARRPDVFQFGMGHYQTRSDLTVNSGTSYVHATMTANKGIANPLQRSMGAPLPRQSAVTSVAEAISAAKKLGYPVVVKPRNGSGGKGVSAHLETSEQVSAAYNRALHVRGGGVLVEEFLPGDDYRLLYFGGEFIAACKRVPPTVVGDGRKTIGELVTESNRQRLADTRFPKNLKKIQLGGESHRVLKAAGHDEDTVPARGEEVLLSSTANGGTTKDTTDEMHPDNIAMGARAARISGIDVCGIDFLLPDATKSYRETGGGICEVNYQPSPLVHMMADGKMSFAVLDRLIDFLCPKGSPELISVLLVDASPTLVQEVTAELKTAGLAHVSRKGVFFERRKIVDCPDSWTSAVDLALRDTGVKVALLEASLKDLRQFGCGLPSISVLVCTDEQSRSELKHLLASARHVVTEMSSLTSILGDALQPEQRATASVTSVSSPP